MLKRYIRLRFLVLWSVIALGGCANPMTYVSPTSGPRAQVRVTNLSGRLNAYINLVANSQNESSRQTVAALLTDSYQSLDFSQGRVTGMPLHDPNWKGRATEFFVAAEAPLNLAVEGMYPGFPVWETCNSSIVFTPTAGGHYELNIGMSPRACSLTLFKISERGIGQFVREPQEFRCMSRSC